jgi:alpha-amylase/alpha-mannosidase (GH57 family)
MEETSLVIHGHFYQPPRENPWTDTVEREAGAHPFHDWNERIHYECYRANAFARISDRYNRVEAILNNYRGISFNFGPTLLTWLEHHHPKTYERILEADRESLRLRSGHGNAIAQSYNHTILPLSTERDRRTQIRWGIEDFRFRFKRDPESLWLPETACDDATLGALIDERLAYVILSPYQAERVRPVGGDAEWRSVTGGNIDTSIPYRYFHRDGSGRSISIFFYHSGLARAIAFEGALASSRALVERFNQAAAVGEGSLVSVATDGETYGHHFRFGDRGLAYALEVEAAPQGLRVTNYGEYLEENPPVWEVEISAGAEGEGTSWSCAHGVSRWIRDCGCTTGSTEGWTQKWRAPLRKALDFLRDEATRAFEETAGTLFLDPWAARDDYIKLIVSRHRFREEFLYRHAGRWLQPEEKERALIFLELQRHSMLMYTSCGWFFSDISGIETLQDLEYAGRVLDLMRELELDPPTTRFLELLAEAESNRPEMGNGADIFRRNVGQARVPPAAIASSHAISSLVSNEAEEGEVAGFRFRREEFNRKRHGRLKLATGRMTLDSVWTGRHYDYAFSAMHFGGVDFLCAIREFPGEAEFRQATEKLWDNFRTASLPTMLRLMQSLFGPEEYGLEHVLPEGRERIAEIVFRNLVKRFTGEYALLYRENRRRIEMLQSAGFELPAELRAAAEFTFSKRFEEEIRRQRQSRDPAAYAKAVRIAREAAKRGYKLDRSSSRPIFEEMIEGAVQLALTEASAENIQSALDLITLAESLGIDMSLERPQEEIYQALLGGSVTGREVGELAIKVGFAPSVLTKMEPEEPGETQASSEEAIVS